MAYYTYLHQTRRRRRMRRRKWRRRLNHDYPILPLYLLFQVAEEMIADH
jgi:hypothetical protein